MWLIYNTEHEYSIKTSNFGLAVVAYYAVGRKSKNRTRIVTNFGVGISPDVEVGKIKSIGPGPKYQVGPALRKLDDGDWVMEITLIETGEPMEYRLSLILSDPDAF